MRFPLYIPVSRLRQSSICLLAALLVACSPKVATRGHVDAAGNLNKIEAGRSHRQDVLQLLGSPSTVSSFGAETWYYVAAQQEGYAFLAPEITRQQVTQISFDENGIVKEKKQYDLKDRQKVAIAEDTTPTAGHQLGFVEQILGNVGRFNKPKEEAR